MPDVFLYQGESNPADVKLRDPTVLSGGVTVIPATATLSLTSFAPAVPVVITPDLLALVVTSFAPQIPTTVTPSTVSLVTVTFAPQVPVQVTPSTVSLVLSTFAPQIPTQVTPLTTTLVITTFAPTVDVGAPPPIDGGFVGYHWHVISSVQRVRGSLNFYLPTFALSFQGTVRPGVRHGKLLSVAFLEFRTELSGTVEPLVEANEPVAEIGSVGINGTVNLSAHIHQLRFTGTLPRVIKEYDGITFYNDYSLSFDVPEGYEVSVIIVPAGAEEYMDVPLSVLEPIIQKTYSSQ